MEYRRALASSFLFKFFVGTSLSLERDSEVRLMYQFRCLCQCFSEKRSVTRIITPHAQSAFSPDFPAEYRSAGVPYDRHPAHGVQFYSKASNDVIVGQPQRHMAADLQVTGEATYTDDVKHSADILVAALVTSTRPHAKLVRSYCT